MREREHARPVATNLVKEKHSMSRKYTREAGMLTADERQRALARILAVGLRRLERRPAPPAAQNSSESAPNCLEVSPKTVLSVHTG
jgi:hypothetical protein